MEDGKWQRRQISLMHCLLYITCTARSSLKNKTTSDKEQANQSPEASKEPHPGPST